MLVCVVTEVGCTVTSEAQVAAPVPHLHEVLDLPMPVLMAFEANQSLKANKKHIAQPFGLRETTEKCST